MSVIRMYIKDAQRHRVLSNEELNSLAIRAKAGDSRAMHTLVTANLRLVMRIAVKMWNKNLDVSKEDLIQEGNIGLMRAVAKYDPSKGYTFAGYATVWIRRYVRDAIYADEFGTPRHHAPAVKKVRDEVRYGHNINYNVLAEHTKGSVEGLRATMDMAHVVHRLDGSESAWVIYDNSHTACPQNQAVRAEQKRVINMAISHLHERSRTIITLRYVHEKSLRDCAQTLGVSPTMVMKIERQALSDLAGLLPSALFHNHSYSEAPHYEYARGPGVLA